MSKPIDIEKYTEDEDKEFQSKLDELMAKKNDPKRKWQALE